MTMCCGIISPSAQCEPSVGLVPLPVTLDWREGVFRMTSATCVAAEGDAAIEARKLTDALAPALGFRLRLLPRPVEREYSATCEHRMYMTYPRAAALAEVLWSPKADRDYEGFLKRLNMHGERLRPLHVSYRPW